VKLAMSREGAPSENGNASTWPGRLGAAVARFDAGWRGGARPSIETFLAEFAEADGGELLATLLPIELRFRVDRGEQPALADYLARFPRWPAMVEAAFTVVPQESTVADADGDGAGSGSSTVHGDDAANAETAIDEAEARTVSLAGAGAGFHQQGPGGTADEAETLTMSAPEEALVPLMIQSRYRVVRLLGGGGFGRVYLAWDEEIERHVAIKLPRRGLFTAARQVDDFLREARMVARVRHPAIVSVFDVGRQDDGPVFVVMEYVDGRTLADVLRSERRPLSALVGILAAVADAVSHAHSRGLIHRDLKPENILIDRDGAPRVTDFGLAVHEDFQRLRHGEIAGTPAYMSPEQVLGETHRFDGRTDVWGLGVILYQILSKRRPFNGSCTEIFDAVLHRDPKPPRQVNPTIPEELERVCLKCLMTRMTDRYASAADLAADLRGWLEQSTSASTPAPSPGDEREPPRLVPKGLRAFDREDADFFLELIPGPRDRRGLPECVRFWKNRIEETDVDRTFRVGLIYGPSGCGKSSLMKAGILPRLSGVSPVYVEATATDTEDRLREALRRHHPELPRSRDLPEDVATLRGRDDDDESGRKVVIVIDQFEQWLHAHPDDHDGELIRALRQCDGRRVQCVLMVRDDFWMAITGFLHDVEVKLVEGENSAGFELFDHAHARRVLAQFGRAFERLPIDADGLSAEQSRFLDQAVDCLKRDDGRVVPVRLSLFAEMMRGKPWSDSVLRGTGGSEGLGAAYLEETFNRPSAPPTHRLHQRAARTILKSLLPARDTAIKGGLRTREELLAESGYADRPDQFDELMHILDAETRLITPTDPKGREPEHEAESAPVAAGDRCYQLAHDELVPSIRLWLTRRQRETRQGRAELRLEDQSALWDGRPEPRYLPSFIEWCYFRVYTSKTQWSASQRRMMGAATRHLLKKAVTAAAVVSVLVVAGLIVYASANPWGHSLLGRLVDAEYPAVPKILAELRPHRVRFLPDLQRLAHVSPADSKARVVAALALLDDDPRQLEFLRGRLLVARPDEFQVVREALRPHASGTGEALWGVLKDPTRERSARLRAAAALAAYDPRNPRWEEGRGDVALALVHEERLQLAQWTELLRPARGWLTPALRGLYLDARQSESMRTAATLVLAEYLRDDPAAVSELILDANPERFRILIGILRAEPGESAPRLMKELVHVAEPRWLDPSPAFQALEPALDPTAVAAIEAAGGMVAPRFAFCHSLPLADFEALAPMLGKAGYRPTCLRPFSTGGRLLVATAWARDGRKWRMVLGKTPEKITEEDKSLRAQRFLPVDIAGYVADDADHPVRYAALWVDAAPREPALEFLDARMYVAVPDEKHGDAWKPLQETGFTPRTGFSVARRGGGLLYSSVRWKLRDVISYFGDSWNDSSWADAESEVGHATDLALSPVELRFSLSSTPRAVVFASVWWPSTEYETRVLQGLTPTEHLGRCRALVADGFRPSTVSAAAFEKRSSAGSEVETASVWRRPLVEEEARDALARRQANAAVALLHLGRPERLWQALRLRDDPRLRSALISRLAPLGVDPRVLLTRLEREPDVSTRRALLMALAGYDSTEAPADLGDEAVARFTALAREDPDPGVHAAAELALARAGGFSSRSQRAAEAIEDGPSGADSRRRWYVDREGHTLVVLPGPLTFLMGSPGNEPQREHHEEALHARRIERTIAVASKEVTFEQFLRFDPSHSQATRYAPDRDHPVNMVSWFDAARYCNWLSKQEGIPRDQWCYPDPLGPVVKLGPKVVTRIGYRLPTEAEWEYACRAGTRTSRYYGISEELLPRYALTVASSGYRLRPVGSLLPNDFGLFDTLGNVLEWTNSPGRPFNNGPTDDLPAAETLDSRSLRSMRGGSFLGMPSSARATQRNEAPAASRGPTLAFRVARTLPDPPSPARAEGSSR
jgi:serine/threonine protein kinase/formylglycine-generating enzyme required for sulfatase activity